MMLTWWEREERHRFRLYVAVVISVYAIMMLAFFMHKPWGQVTSVYQIESVCVRGGSTFVFSLVDLATGQPDTLTVSPPEMLMQNRDWVQRIMDKVEFVVFAPRGNFATDTPERPYVALTFCHAECNGPPVGVIESFPEDRYSL